MVKDFRDLDINLINSICNDFETYRDFNILRQIYPYLDYNILYSVLFSIGKYKKELYSKLQQVNIGDKKILLISDTHYGSAHDNMKYAHEVFNFAVANGIRSIFHGGDIIESEVNAEYSVTFGEENPLGAAIEYSTDGGANWGTVAVLDVDTTAIAQNETVTVPIQWRWAFTAEGNAVAQADRNEADTLVGFGADTTDTTVSAVTVTATLQLDQVN